MTNSQKQIVNRLSKDEISALAYGFPLPPANWSFNGANELTDKNDRMDVNGNWSSLKVPMNQFDGGFEFAGEEFDNFLTKKSRQREALKKDLRKDNGLSRKEAREQAKKDIPKDTLKTIAKNQSKTIGHAIVVASLVVPRASYISLVAINFRGVAYKVNSVLLSKDEALKEKLKKKWYGLGGDWALLVKTATNGATRKPAFCGKKCKLKLAEKDLKRQDKSTKVGRNKSFDGLDTEFSNGAGIDDGALAVWVGLGTAVLSAMAKITDSVSVSKTEQQAIQSAEDIANKENETLTTIEKEKVALAEKQLVAEGNPTNLITNNPDLSPQEKREALAVLSEATGKDTKSKVLKYALYGGLAIAGIFIISKILKKK
jgi:hypothetical protein